MIYRHEHRGGTWVDIERPTNEEIRQVANEFSIGERLETELLSPTPLPLVAGDSDFVLLVLHFPAQGEQDGESKNQEVDFVVGKNFVLTIRYEVVAPIHRLRKLLETQGLVGGGPAFSNDTLVEILFAHLFGAVRDHANHIAARLARIERDMFGGRERDTVRSVSLISREFLHLEAALVSQEEPLARFLRMLASRHFFEPAFAERILRINAERAQVARLAGTHRAVATELRETNAVLLEARQNEVMKTLTVISFIVLPLELITFTFGMGVPGTPLVNNPDAFWIILAIMLVTVACMTLFFTRKRWIA